MARWCHPQHGPISPRQLTDLRFQSRVAETADRVGLADGSLGLAITETVLMEKRRPR
jgi:EAL domain-containing protein (putative c-di-GMP-specific phosphodiesterase class I)